MTVEYEPHSKGFYHAYSLKSLTRLCDRLIRLRSFYLVKITNVLDHTFPEFKPFFNERLSKTALYLLENYGSAEKMARMNSDSYDTLRCISRGKFSIQKFLHLKELAANTVGVNNSIFNLELNSLLTLYKSLSNEINTLESEIIKLIEEVHPHYMSVPGIPFFIIQTFFKKHLTIYSLSPHYIGFNPFQSFSIPFCSESSNFSINR